MAEYEVGALFSVRGWRVFERAIGRKDWKLDGCFGEGPNLGEGSHLRGRS